MLTVTVTWLTRAYEAALDTTAEWPPHPARLYCALVAAAREGSTDDDALRWLEAQAPPVVLAPQASPSTLTAFVPTNAVSAETRSNRVGRTSGERVWQRSHLTADHAHFAWEEASPDAATLATLQRLARRVPFLGRSTSQAVVTVADQPPPASSLTRTEPQAAGDQRLRVPYRGYLDALRAAFQDGDPARGASRWAFYGLPAPAPDKPAVHQGPYPTLLTLSFARGIGLDGRLAVRVATAFKKAVLQCLGDHFDDAALALVHGHHDGTRRQCAFLALPFVGHRHATGQLLGVGIGLSSDLEAEVRRALLEVCGLHLDRPGLTQLEIPGLASVELEPAEPVTVQGSRRASSGSARWSTRPQRWAETATTWVTALPIVLDRYPDHLEEASGFVAQGCVLAGYPEPAPGDVEHLPASTVRGAPRLRGSDLRRRRADPPRPAVHVRIRFPAPVIGPVVVGHLRHVGLGLCVPDREEAAP